MAVSGYNTPVRSPSPRSIKPVFGDAAFECTFSGILSDMDGTLIDSTNAVVRHWQRIGNEYGIDPNVILATSHGRRSIDVFQQIDPARATWDYVRELERQVPLLFGDQAVEIPGARRFLTSLENSNARWAIVTSGTRPLVEGWLKVLRLAEPKRLVTAEDVARGKPDPACYLIGREKLDVRSSAPCLVLEDAPAGIRAGKAAGCKVLALATTHSMEQLRGAGADWIVPDLRSIQLTKVDHATGELSVRITGAVRC